MGFTHHELLKGLPSAIVPFATEKISDLVYRLVHGEQWVLLTLKPEASRSIASITLPVTWIKLEFFGFSLSEFDVFMHRFKQYLQKGGG